MTKEDEARWAELAEAATPGPWRVKEVDEHGMYVGPNCYDVVPITQARPIEVGGPDVGSMSEADARFVAEARTAVPSLLAALTASREGNDRLRAEVERLHGPFRCCPHCVDDPEYHAENPKHSHDVDCTLCDDPIMLRAALAAARVEVTQLQARARDLANEIEEEAQPEPAWHNESHGEAIRGRALHWAARKVRALAEPLGSTEGGE